VDHLHHGTPEFSPDAEKYEGGMLTFPVLYAMEASLGMILELGPEPIQQRVLELAGKLRRLLRGLGARLPADESPHFDSSIVAARFAQKPASALARALRARGVLVSARHDHLRVSAHFYNHEADLARLEEELKAAL
jgi:selenocysteine lyase/cysteine desulfurase